MDDKSIQMGRRSVQMDDQSIQMNDQSVQMDDQSVQMDSASVSMNDPFELKYAPFFLSGNSVASLANGANGCPNYPGSAVGGFYQAVHTSNKKYPLPFTANNFNLKASL